MGSDELFPSIGAGGELERRLVEVYATIGRTLDDLPYTPEFERLYEFIGGEGAAPRREVFRRLHAIRKAGRLPRVGRGRSDPPSLGEDDEGVLASLVEEAAGSLGQRDRLPYAPEFAPLVDAFNRRTGRSLSAHDVWRVVAKLAK